MTAWLIRLAACVFLLTATVSLPPAFAGKAQGTTGFNFLKIGAGARQMAMGDSGVAISGDANSSAYNPASMSDVNQQEAGFLHTQWLEDISYQYAAYVHPHPRWGHFGFSLNRLSYGEIEGYDRNNKKTSNPTASDTALGISYARTLKRGLSAGITSRYIREDLSAAVGQTFGFDLGTLYRPSGDRWWSNLTGGLALRNLGPKASFIREGTELPMQADLGVSYTEWKGRLTGALEAHKAKDQDVYFSAGGEFTTKEVLSLRLGYRTGRDIGPGFSAGFGLHLMEGNLSFDYAFVPFQDFGNVHRAGFIYRFGGIVQTHFKKGVKLMRSGKYAEAILEFDKVLQKNPEHGLAARYMRKCAQQLKREEQP